MKRTLLFTSLALALTSVAAATLERPPVTSHTVISEAVDLEFAINGFDGKGLELELRKGPRGRLFLQFEMNARNGQATLTGAGSRGQVDEMQDLPNWPFLGRQDGAPILTHSFNNQLVELDDGENALRVRYTGADVPMLRSLQVQRNVTFPAFLGRALGHTGPIQLQRGTYPIEEDGGATVPVRLLGR